MSNFPARTVRKLLVKVCIDYAIIYKSKPPRNDTIPTAISIYSKSGYKEQEKANQEDDGNDDDDFIEDALDETGNFLASEYPLIMKRALDWISRRMHDK